MKKITFFQSLYLVLIFLLIQSCATADVASNKSIQKRKYRKGWHVEMNTADNKKDHKRSENVASNTFVEASVKQGDQLFSDEEVSPRVADEPAKSKRIESVETEDISAVEETQIQPIQQVTKRIKNESIVKGQEIMPAEFKKNADDEPEEKDKESDEAKILLILASVALIFGIISLPLFFFFGIIFGGLAIVFGATALIMLIGSPIEKAPRKKVVRRSIWAIVLGCLAGLLNIALFVLLAVQ